MIIPAHYKLQYSEKDIFSAVRRIGAEISEWADEVMKRDGQDILGLPVLRGGIFFYADLMKQITFSVEMAPIRTRSYIDAVNAAPREQVEVNLEGVDVHGRKVLLVDDICDSGRTLKVLSEYLVAGGAEEVRTAVLIHRLHDASVFRPNWVGFEYHGQEWFVGYGMEDSNRWTNLPRIYTIPAE